MISHRIILLTFLLSLASLASLASSQDGEATTPVTGKPLETNSTTTTPTSTTTKAPKSTTRSPITRPSSSTPPAVNETEFEYGHYCVCDLKYEACDVNCCCDTKDCTIEDMDSFSQCDKVEPHNLNSRYVVFSACGGIRTGISQCQF